MQDCQLPVVPSGAIWHSNVTPGVWLLNEKVRVLVLVWGSGAEVIVASGPVVRMEKSRVAGVWSVTPLASVA